MSLDPKILVGLAALAFVLAVVVAFGVNLLGMHAEAFSRASNNLALLAIAWMMLDKHGSDG